VSEQVVFGGRRYEAIDLSQRFSNATSEVEPMPHTIEYTTHVEAAPATEEKFGIPA
jgi:hypothetical protein